MHTHPPRREVGNGSEPTERPRDLGDETHLDAGSAEREEDKESSPADYAFDVAEVILTLAFDAWT